MSELELQLLALGRGLELPAERDLAPAVAARLEGQRPFPWRRVAVVALAVLVVAIAAAFAVPQARTTILRWFHLGGATVERVETLPPAVERSKAGGLGRAMSLKQAERTVGFHILLPPYKSASAPGRVYVLRDVMATVIPASRRNARRSSPSSAPSGRTRSRSWRSARARSSSCGWTAGRPSGSTGVRTC